MKRLQLRWRLDSVGFGWGRVKTLILDYFLYQKSPRPAGRLLTFYIVIFTYLLGFVLIFLKNMIWEKYLICFLSQFGK